MKSTKNYSSGQAFKRGVVFLFHYFHDLSLFVPFHWTFFLSFFQHFCLFPFNFWDVGVFFFLLVSGLRLHVFLGTPSYRGTYMDRNLDEVFDSLPYSLLSTRVFLFCSGIFLEAWMWTGCLYHMMFLEATVCIDLLQLLFVCCDWPFVFCLYVAPRPLI